MDLLDRSLLGQRRVLERVAVAAVWAVGLQREGGHRMGGINVPLFDGSGEATRPEGNHTHEGDAPAGSC